MWPANKNSNPPRSNSSAFALNRRVVLKTLLASACFAIPPITAPAFARASSAQQSQISKPAIVVRTTENVTEGSWVWLLNAARDAGVGRIYLLMKQDENRYESVRTSRTWISGELLAPLPDVAAAEGWEDPAWLDEMLSRASSYGIEVHAWWPCFQDAAAAGSMPNASYPGGTTEVFLDPAYPEVGDYQKKLIRKLLKRYPFDGIALDWLRYNDRSNGSAGPLGEKFAEAAGMPWSKEAMSDPLARAIWDDMRAQTVADWVRSLLAELRPVNPGVSWSAFVLPWMFKEVAQSYRHLSRAGIDSLLPMIYWRDWKEEVTLTSEILSPTPFFLSGRTTLGPTFDITTSAKELKEALGYLPKDRLGCVTWYNHGQWTDEDFGTLSEVTLAFHESQKQLYEEPASVSSHLPADLRLEPARFSPEAAVWSVVCLGELYRRGKLERTERVVPVLAFHRFTDGKLGSGPSDWHTSTSYVDAILAFLKSLDFNVITVAQLGAYMTSETGKTLPKRPLVISIDDGSASITKLFEPRAAAAGVPYAIGLVTEWLGEEEGRVINVGDNLTDQILNWRDVKTLFSTGRVSILSHSHAQHYYAKSGWGGTEQGAAITSRLWIDGEQRLETEGERVRRVFDDLTASRQSIHQHLGTTPSFLVWPYGLRDAGAEQAARDVGFSYFLEFTGNAFAAPRKNSQSIMRVSVMLADEAVPVAFPKDTLTGQRWWLAFLQWARGSQSVDLIEATISQIETKYQDHPEVWISRAAALVLNGHSILASRLLNVLKSQYPHDGEVHSAIDEFQSNYQELV
jgi:Polysaccharide deacetylase/Glycosyl hydrolase-like 10